MSAKRILGITLFGVLFIVAVIGVMLLTSFLRRDSDAVQLPDTPVLMEPPGEIKPDALDRVEVNRETIQAVVSDLLRPAIYSRDVLIESFWENDQAIYNIGVSVANGLTSLSTIPPVGVEKRIIITPDTLYIWYRGDSAPYIGDITGMGDEYRTADEWQMLVTYEDVLNLDKNEIIDAGYVEYGGEACVYAEHRSPLLGYTMRYYISLESGLVIAAEEFDETHKLVYRMSAGECKIGEAGLAAFVLPDGTDLLTRNAAMEN